MTVKRVCTVANPKNRAPSRTVPRAIRLNAVVTSLTARHVRI